MTSRLCRNTTSAISSNSDRVMVPPVGLVGKFNTSALLRGVTAFSTASAVSANPFSAEQDTGTAMPWANVTLGE